MSGYVKIKIRYTFCEETGDKILDTERMIEEWNEEMNSLISTNVDELCASGPNNTDSYIAERFIEYTQREYPSIYEEVIDFADSDKTYDDE